MEGPAMSAVPAPGFGDASDVPAGLIEAFDTVRQRLLQRADRGGFWAGRLSSSPLSTATAVSALALAHDPADATRIASGVAWLSGSQNADGGWGDAPDSPSNLATTLLAVAAFELAASATPRGPLPAGSRQRAQQYLALRAGESPAAMVEALQREYGDDRTFAVPILMNCALAGLVPWDRIPGLPFELAILPHAWYKAVRLHVVSYALPALIAIGLALERHNPTPGVLRPEIRKMVTPRVLKKLEDIQPNHGGFLEATPLTSFVAMALLPLYGRQQPVVARALQFLRRSQRDEGAWPIDTDLSLWLTTAAVTALAAADELPRIDRNQTARWIAAAQHKIRHPYTQAEPGGWAWTHRVGGVPDVDDTSAAILALQALGCDDGIAAGARWLLALQNGDGGWPTFCRGWGKLPFDKSSPDLTAHALRALRCAGNVAGVPRSSRAIGRGLGYLCRSQQPDGSWIPLWFGNQAAPGQTNPVLGTARVLRALELMDRDGPQALRGVEYLLRAQNADGGWGGAPSVASSVEETALAVAALAPWTHAPKTRTALFRGVEYLVGSVDRSDNRPAPIGLYFAHLWYCEDLYPLIWTLDALSRATRIVRPLRGSPQPPAAGAEPFDLSPETCDSENPR
jgi:squalene-hopene/tetraprenyl-beta-curcumene cyclase